LGYHWRKLAGPVYSIEAAAALETLVEIMPVVAVVELNLLARMRRSTLVVRVDQDT
jgi:hypothetical protein